MALVTVMSPGPGVVMTLTNTLRFGLKEAIGGILGIATGTLIVATLSATGLGILLTTSTAAFMVMKVIGSGYLLYLAFKLWRAPLPNFKVTDTTNKGARRLFLQGFSLQLTNPKAIFFFLSVFPQFIDKQLSNQMQFPLLILTYCALVVLIHCMYGCCANRAKLWLTSNKGGKILNRTGACIFAVFGFTLGVSSLGGA